jgi:molecular chaperone DnaK
MAAYNKTLGRFQLAGIPAAPRGVPQIEVTFDIDANGIVHVSAKDLGTGNEQKIVITASTNLTETEIEQAVKEAEAHAEEDKKNKEAIEVRNNADSMVYNTEKTLKDLEGKISAEEKEKVEAELANVKKALEGTNVEEIKNATEKLKDAFYKISEKLYANAASAAQSAGPEAGSDDEPKEGTVHDADYKVE